MVDGGSKCNGQKTFQHLHYFQKHNKVVNTDTANWVFTSPVSISLKFMNEKKNKIQYNTICINSPQGGFQN